MNQAVAGPADHQGAEPRSERPFWKDALAPYARPHVGRSLLDIATSVLPYLALSYVMYLSLSVSYLLTLALAVPTAGFLLRTYILFHDCAHGSFLPSKRANLWLGVVLGLLVYSPFHSWRHSHAVHHATSGDLDRRGTGDVPTLTVAEYRALPWHRRMGYRLFRNPIVMFGLGPIWSLMIAPRFVPRGSRPRIRRSIIYTNVALGVMLAGLCWLMGWKEFLLVQMPTAWIAGSAGVFLFFVQHQFEDAYWESSGDWSYADARSPAAADVVEQRSPAAAQIEHAATRADPDLLGDVVVLAPLGLLEAEREVAVVLRTAEVGELAQAEPEDPVDQRVGEFEVGALRHERRLRTDAQADWIVRRAWAQVTSRRRSSSHSLSRTVFSPSHSDRVGTSSKIGLASWARCRL